MAIIYLFLAIIIILGSIAICYIIFYNLIQYSLTKINQAESIIDETLRIRYDLFIRVDNLIKATLKEDKSYFKDLDKLKSINISNFDLDRKLNIYVQLFEQLKNDIKDIANNKAIKDITKELKESEEKLTAGKAYYNKNVTDYNRYIKLFPANIIAQIHHFQTKNYFDNKDMTDDDLDDFKL